MIRRARVKTRTRKLANKQVEHARREQQSRVASGSKPAINAERAAEYAKLLTSGVPPLLALRYIAPAAYASLNDAGREVWLGEWAGSPLVLDAVNRLNGGAWHDLKPDVRLQLALDKHLAELAHFLYTHPYDQLLGADLSKANTAADRLTDFLTDSDDSASSPWRTFVEEFMSKLDATAQPNTGLPVIPATPRES